MKSAPFYLHWQSRKSKTIIVYYDFISRLTEEVPTSAKLILVTDVRRTHIPCIWGQWMYPNSESMLEVGGGQQQHPKPKASNFRQAGSAALAAFL